MKKIILGSMIASSCLLAGNDFIGLSLGVSSLSGKVSGTGLNGATPITYEANDSENATGFGLQVGTYLNDNYRIVGKYDAQDKSLYTYTELTVGVDYFFNTESSYKPFIGAYAGYGDIDILSIWDKSGFVYGLNGGFTKKLDNNLDLEVGYKYSFVNISQVNTYNNEYTGVDIDNDGFDDRYTGDLKGELEVYDRLYFAFNYKF